MLKSPQLAPAKEGWERSPTPCPVPSVLCQASLFLHLPRREHTGPPHTPNLPISHSTPSRHCPSLWCATPQLHIQTHRHLGNPDNVSAPLGVPPSQSPLPLVCTHRMKVGYSSAFTRHTIWNTMVIPIRPRQATARFNQCKSGEEAQRVWNTSARSHVPRKLGLQSWKGWEDCLIWPFSLSPDRFGDLITTRIHCAKGRGCFLNLRSASCQLPDSGKLFTFTSLGLGFLNCKWAYLHTT